MALRNGFYSLEYFSEIFRKTMGVSPSVYKKFCISKNNVSNIELNNILNALVKLISLIEFVNEYKNNRKPIVFPVKELSIFIK